MAIPTIYLAGAASFILILVILEWSLRLKLDPREPPLYPQKIPIIGHLIGFVRHGNSYWHELSKKNYMPIYTLPMPNGKTYVVNSTELVKSVQYNAKTISFDPILTTVSERLAGIKGDVLQVLQESETGGQGAHRKMVHSMQPSLVGYGLDLMNKAMLENLASSIDGLDACKGPLNLWKWTRVTISMASTNAVFGPRNPYAFDDYEEMFWAYESRITHLLINVAPKITARKAYHLRETLAAKMISYYESGAWKQASVMTRTRCQAGIDNGVSLEAIARLDVPGGTGILSNTVPTAFWTLCHVYSAPKLLEEIREEISKVFVVDKSGTYPLYTLDAADLRTKCPILFSAYQETLRYRACFASPRFVLEDTTISGSYLLKKGSMLQIPSAVLHSEATQWGENAEIFDPYRFTKASSIKRSPVSYRAFGGAPALCPGRHFATVEVMCFVAMVTMRYDITPVGGVWNLPLPNYSNVAASILPPVKDIPVEVHQRKGFENCQWKYQVTSTTEEKTLFALASE